MSQTIDWNVPTVGPATPTEMATRTSDSLDALLSKHSGSARPPYAVAGTEWADTSVAGTIKVKLFDGAADRLLYTVDLTTGLISLPSPQILLKQSATPGPTAEGDLQWDTDDNALVVGDGAGQKVFRSNDWEKIAFYNLSGVSSLVEFNLGAFRLLRVHGFVLPSIGTTTILQISSDNGSTFKNGATDVTTHLMGASGSAAPDTSYGSQGFGYLIPSATANAMHTFDHQIFRFNKPAPKIMSGRSGGTAGTGSGSTYAITNAFSGGNVVAANALRILTAAAATMSGEITIEGIRG